MYDLKPNLEPGNPDGHTVLRYLVEAKLMPLEAAVECVYKAVAKYAQEYRADQGKLLGGMIVTGVLGLPVFFPFGVSSLLIAGVIAGSAFRWQELGSMRSRLRGEYAALKDSVLLEQFIKWLAQELRERRRDSTSGQFQPDAITTANILAAYEHTIFAVTNGEHLENNASDPILALFVLKLRQHTNHLPEWVISAFRQLEQAEVQRANDVEKASRYMWGNLEERYPEYFNKQQIQPKALGSNTRLEAVEVPAQSVQEEGEQSLGKPKEIEMSCAAQPRSVLASVPLSPEQWTPDLMGYPSILIYGAQGAGKTSTAAWLIRERLTAGHQVKVLDPHREYGQWDGLECIGDGMDYDAINDELKTFTSEIKARYKARALTPNYDPPKLTLVCDEFTQWAKKCGHSATFFEESLTDIRKINLHVLFISHARTLTGLGGSSGLAATRDAGLLELELEAQVDPQTKKASPKLLGWLKYPGMPMNDRIRVAIASWMNGSMDFSGLGATPEVVQPPQPKPTEQQSWDRLILEATDEQINELIDKMRNGSVQDSSQDSSEPHQGLQTIDEQIDFAVQAIAEYLQERNLESDTARNIYRGKNRLKKVAPKLADFNLLLELASEMEKIGYFNEGNVMLVKLIPDS